LTLPLVEKVLELLLDLAADSQVGSRGCIPGYAAYISCVPITCSGSTYSTSIDSITSSCSTKSFRAASNNSSNCSRENLGCSSASPRDELMTEAHISPDCKPLFQSLFRNPIFGPITLLGTFLANSRTHDVASAFCQILLHLHS
jgi:hypothetical protein